MARSANALYAERCTFNKHTHDGHAQLQPTRQDM